MFRKSWYFAGLFAIAFTTLVLSVPMANGQGMIQVKGSDSEVNLVQRLAEVFMQKNPGVNISVTGGGSGTGIAALINKQTDIANSSRELSAKEEEAAKKAGVSPFRVAFATDGISVILHPENPVSKLTVDQLGKIFKGEIGNWKEVGGPDMKISLYGRQSNSGTYVFFREFVLKGDYSQHMKSMNGNAQIVEGVQRDKAGVGYAAVGYVVGESGEVKPGSKNLECRQRREIRGLFPGEDGKRDDREIPHQPSFESISERQAFRQALRFHEIPDQPRGPGDRQEAGVFPGSGKLGRIQPQAGICKRNPE